MSVYKRQIYQIAQSNRIETFLRELECASFDIGLGAYVCNRHTDTRDIIQTCYSIVFTARCYASAVLAMGLCPCLSVSVCLCPSVTSRCSTKTQTTPHDTPGSLIFWCQRSPRNSTGVTPYEGAECRWGGQNRRLSTNISKTVQDRHIVSIKVE